MSIILNANHIYKTYGKDESEVKALKDVSLSIKEGTFVTIVGQSGSGKSTLAREMEKICKNSRRSKKKSQHWKAQKSRRL